MLTILGLKVSYETLLFLGLFVASEVVGNSKLKSNSVVQIILAGINALKPLRKEDDKLQHLKDTFK
jgi:tRNA U34 5-carboxymethylaminomethyl modifying enzyme MnmG/GidA